MNAILIIFVLSAITPFSEGADALEGKWQVDLRASPEAAPYTKVLDIKMRNNGTFSGRFYGSKFKKGVVNESWPQLCLAFRTEDRNNAYFHTAQLRGDTLIGQTYCPNRQFTAPWTATRMDQK